MPVDHIDEVNNGDLPIVIFNIIPDRPNLIKLKNDNTLKTKAAWEDLPILQWENQSSTVMICILKLTLFLSHLHRPYA